MYQLLESTKQKIVRECFESLCENAHKEESGTFKGLVNSISKPSVYFDQEKLVLVTEKKRELSINYIYKLGTSNKRVQIIDKIEEPYRFQVKINDETIVLDCDQYNCKVLE